MYNVHGCWSSDNLVLNVIISQAGLLSTPYHIVGYIVKACTLSGAISRVCSFTHLLHLWSSPPCPDLSLMACRWPMAQMAGWSHHHSRTPGPPRTTHPDSSPQASLTILPQCYLPTLLHLLLFTLALLLCSASGWRGGNAAWRPKLQTLCYIH